jgi:formamidopyrimidine-DNA glycosylase
MPELPEVERARRALERAAAGKRLTSVRALHPSAVRALPARDADAVAGATLARVERRGKHQLLRLDDGRTLHAHFRMNGDWDVGRAGEALPAHARYLLDFDDGTRVALTDSRALATIRLHAADADPLPALGPEATSPDFDADVLHAALARRRTPVKVALLDQRVVAGLGNIYAVEALWHARVSPRAVASKVSVARCARIVEGARQALADADGDPGRYQDGDAVERLNVYGREGEPCRRCGRRIRRIVQAGRSTYFCAGCQK